MKRHPTNPRSLQALRLFALSTLLLLLAACGQPTAGGGAVPPGGVFDPQSDVTLPGGAHTFEAFFVRAGITVRVAADAVVEVAGDSVVAGTLSGDCAGIELRVGGDLTLDGRIDNSCGDLAAAGDLTLVTDGTLLIGSTPSNAAAIVTDGKVRIVDSVTEFDPLEPALETATAESSASEVSTHAVAPQAGGAAGRIERPIRARRGVDVRLNGDVDVGPAGALVAGDGDDAVAAGPLDTANCDRSNLIGGRGGSVYLASRGGTLTVSGDLTAGDGGAGADCYDTLGHPSDASAFGGRGGRGGSVFVGGVSVRFVGAVTVTRGNGGPGGYAEAEGLAGQTPCAPGFAATATGGEGGAGGGVGTLTFSGPPGNIVGAPVEDGGNGGAGGAAVASGGAANPVCDALVAGAGGAAVASGGRGGAGALGTIWPVVGGHISGAGGDASAFGGDGGHGNDDCVLFFLGGAGGFGGDGSAFGGAAGRKGASGLGLAGQATAFGGLGGDGGDGLPPGAGGAKGGASALGRNPRPTSGLEGLAGDPCALPLGFFLAALDLPDGALEPGQFGLAVLDLEGEQTGGIVEVVVRSDGADYAVENGHLLVGERGGLEFGFAGVQGAVTAFRATTATGCSGGGTVRLRGLVANEVVAERTFELGAGATRLELFHAEGFDDLYLESEGPAICFGPSAFELAVAPAAEVGRRLDAPWRR